MGTKHLDTGFPTRTAPCQGAQQPWLKLSCKHRASWGQSGTRSCSRALRGARTRWDHGMSLCSQNHSMDTGPLWGHCCWALPSQLPLAARPWRMFLRTFPVVTLMAIPATRVSSPAIGCHRPLRLSPEEKPEGNSTQHELCKGLSAVQAVPCEASCSAWPPWIAGFQLQTRLRLHGAAAASPDALLQCHER